jgi:hypothetical protein
VKFYSFQLTDKAALVMLTVQLFQRMLRDTLRGYAWPREALAPGGSSTSCGEGRSHSGKRHT